MAKRNATREELPQSLLSSKTQAFSAKEVDHLASVPQKLVPLPKEGCSKKKLQKMKNLAPYRGRTKEGQIKALSNLRKRMSNPVAALPDPANPPPSVPAIKAEPRQINPIAKKYLRVCLSKEEFDLYVSTWDSWMTDHLEDYVRIEDEADVSSICMETVIQFRINMFRISRPSQDNSTEYNQSCRRTQQARENLAARRVDREAARVGKGNRTTNNSFNVAIMAGEVNEKRILELQKAANKQIAEDFEFLEKTPDSSVMVDALDVKRLPTGEQANADHV